MVEVGVEYPTQWQDRSICWESFCITYYSDFP